MHYFYHCDTIGNFSSSKALRRCDDSTDIYAMHLIIIEFKKMETDEVIEAFLIDILAVEIKKYLSLYKLQLFVQ